MVQQLDILNTRHMLKSPLVTILVLVLILIIAFSLPYVAIRLFSNKNKNHAVEPTTHLSLSSNARVGGTNDPVNSVIKPAPRIRSKLQPPPKSEWHRVKTRNRDTLGRIFSALGISKKTLQVILHDNPHTKALASLKPDQELEFQIRKGTLERLIFPLSPTQILTISRNGKGYRSKVTQRKMDSHDHFVTATLRGSLYGTAKRMNIPSKLIRQMTDIFHWEIDFGREIRDGDRFTIHYRAFFIEDKLVDTGEILAVTYTHKGVAHQAIRHKNAAGDYDYFNTQGTSLRKAFTRYPVNFSHISSAFSMVRYHPILHYARPHRGVDLAAPIGTPIHAIGDGIIDTIGRENGYGNMVKIKHDKTYSSIYGHMLKFQKGLTRGAHVKRGQVIGYVGQSGLASGPHCHYEVHVNHVPKNPTTVDLPRALSVASREMAVFKSKTNTLLARLKLYENAYLATGKKSSKTG